MKVCNKNDVEYYECSYTVFMPNKKEKFNANVKIVAQQAALHHYILQSTPLFVNLIV